jgi:hypothetical protein
MTKSELLKRLNEIGTEIAGMSKPIVGDEGVHWIFCVADEGGGEKPMADCFSNILGDPLVIAGAALFAILKIVPNDEIVEFQDDLFREVFYQMTVRNNLTDEQQKDSKYLDMARRAAELLFGICKKGMTMAAKDFTVGLAEAMEPKKPAGCEILLFPRPKGPIKPKNN